jgi:hypothetical protein
LRAGSLENAGSLIRSYRAGDSGGSTFDGASQLAQNLGLGVNEGNRWSGNQLVDGTISGVVDQWLGVGGNPESDGAVDADAVGNHALREREGDGARQTANQHLTEETISGSIDGRRAEGQKRANANRSGVRNGQGWVRGDAEVATRNEGSSESQNLIRHESEIEGLRDSGSGVKDVQDRLVASFDGQDSTGGSEEDGIRKEAGSSEISGDTDMFHQTSDAGHGLDIGQNAREVERAGIDGCASKGLDTLPKCNRMGSFIALDGQELLNGELRACETSIGKIAFFELGKSFSIKLGLELFQNVREFEDQEVGRNVLVLPLPWGGGYEERNGESDDRCSETHCV